MKKLLILLLAGAMLASLASCKTNENTKGTTVTDRTTDPVTAEPEPEDDELLYNKDYALNFDSILTIPLLSDLTLSQAELNANWETMVSQITSQYTLYDPAKEDYLSQKGDKVNIHYKGYAANEEDKISESILKNMSNYSYDANGELLSGDDLVLGSNTMIGAYESKDHPEKNNPGFEDQLIGMKAGETRTITVTFPDSYGNAAELQGMVVKFDVTVNSISVGSVPELTDEMVAGYTQNAYTTIEALKEYVIDYYKGTLAFNALENAAVIQNLPTNLVDDEITQYVYEYIEYTYPGEKLTEEETKVIFDEQYNNAKAYAEKTVKAKLILEALFVRYNITLTWAEYKTMRSQYFAQDYYLYSMYYGITTEEEYEDFIGRDTMIQQCKYEKLLEVIKADALFQ